jgi:hypothetical protein
VEVIAFGVGAQGVCYQDARVLLATFVRGNGSSSPGCQDTFQELDLSTLIGIKSIIPLILRFNTFPIRAVQFLPPASTSALLLAPLQTPNKLLPLNIYSTNQSINTIMYTTLKPTTALIVVVMMAVLSSPAAVAGEYSF